MPRIKLTPRGFRYVDPSGTFPRLDEYLLIPLPAPAEDTDGTKASENVAPPELCKGNIDS